MDIFDQVGSQPAPSALQNLASKASSALQPLAGLATHVMDSAGDAISGAVHSLASASPSYALQKAGNFLSNAAGAVSNGVHQAPLIPQAIDQARKLPDILRQAQQTLDTNH